jgi:hypothetical protein
MAARPHSADLATIGKMTKSHGLREIGRELGVSRQTVLNWSRAHGIKISSRSESIGRTKRKHPLEVCEKVIALKGVKSASQIAREFRFKSAAVVTGIWSRS